MPVARATNGAYKCRFKTCPHRYDDVIGGNNAFGKHKAGAECIPCLFANQMLDNKQTPDQIEQIPDLMAQFATLLSNTGWTWQHVRDSFERMANEPRSERVV